MDNTPNEAAGAAQAPQTEATPNTNQTPAEAPATPAAPDMHGFTSDQLADMKKFFEANGGFDKIKAKISNPNPIQKQEPNLDARPAMEQQQSSMLAQAPQMPQQPAYRAPEGSLSQQELNLKIYNERLAADPKYAAISDYILKGDATREMASFNIFITNPDGSVNDGLIRRFLDMKAQTVAAKQTAVQPEAAVAPTVDYVQVGEAVTSIDQARAVLRQDSQLRATGRAGHPEVEKAKEYLKNMLNPNRK